MAVAAEASVSPCVAPADLTRLELPLRRTARRLASHKLIMIVALGSSSTAGAGASSAETTYPSRLMVELARRFQTQPIMVLNRGISGERAVDMLARFDESVSAERPDLVLWQVGTNAVLRGYERSKRHWHDIDGMPFEAFLSSDGLHMNDWSYNCFAKALADAIADAATPRESSNASANVPTGETR
jgi:acyl-CoA thioesterase-1